MMAEFHLATSALGVCFLLQIVFTLYSNMTGAQYFYGSKGFCIYHLGDDVALFQPSYPRHVLTLLLIVIVSR